MTRRISWNSIDSIFLFCSRLTVIFCCCPWETEHACEPWCERARRLANWEYVCGESMQIKSDSIQFWVFVWVKCMHSSAVGTRKHRIPFEKKKNKNKALFGMSNDKQIWSMAMNMIHERCFLSPMHSCCKSPKSVLELPNWRAVAVLKQALPQAIGCISSRTRNRFCCQQFLAFERHGQETSWN